MASADKSDGTSAGRWRFSLRTMLLLVVIVCLAVPLIIQSVQLREAREELSRLWDETGRLTVEDRSKVHVMFVGSPEPKTWKWRVFLPKGTRYGWSLAHGNIPAKGFPKPTTNAFWNDPYDQQDNEVLVTASIREIDSGKWQLSVSSRIGNSEAQMGGAIIPIAAETLKRESGCIVSDVLGRNETKLLDPGEPIVLLRNRACGTLPDGSEGVTDTPTTGYMIWMRPN